ncbi:MAG TPA: M24 family metallopeptidase [bacterium]|nr:M24 family metallopeptidase [bacterium]
MIFTNRIKKILEASEISKEKFLLINNTIDCYYYSGFKSSNAYILLNPLTSYYLTDNRYFAAAQKKIKHLKVIAIAQSLFEQLKKILKNKYLVVNANNTSLQFYNELIKQISKKKIIIKSIDLADLRAQKNSDELQKIRNSAKIITTAFPKILEKIKSGITEFSLKNEIDYLLRLYGADENSFDTIVLFGKRTMYPHGQSDKKNKLKKNDIILIDFGAKLNEYCSDITRMIMLGKKNNEFIEKYEIIKTIKNNALQHIKLDDKYANIENYIITELEKNKLARYYLHSAGHGVGLAIHEKPTINRKSTDIIKNNQVFTIEPGVYIPNKFGIRIEDMYAVINNKLTKITNLSDELFFI